MPFGNKRAKLDDWQDDDETVEASTLNRIGSFHNPVIVVLSDDDETPSNFGRDIPPPKKQSNSGPQNPSLTNARGTTSHKAFIDVSIKTEPIDNDDDDPMQGMHAQSMHMPASPHASPSSSVSSLLPLNVVQHPVNTATTNTTTTIHRPVSVATATTTTATLHRAPSTSNTATTAAPISTRTTTAASAAMASSSSTTRSSAQSQQSKMMSLPRPPHHIAAPAAAPAPPPQPTLVSMVQDMAGWLDIPASKIRPGLLDREVSLHKELLQRLDAIKQTIYVQPTIAPSIQGSYKLQQIDEGSLEERIKAKIQKECSVFCQVYPSPKTKQYRLQDISWSKVLQRYIKMEGTKQNHVFVGLEERDIGPDDPRVFLRGQKGLFVRNGWTIPKHTVLGPYVCHVNFEKNYEKKSLTEFQETEVYAYQFTSIEEWPNRKHLKDNDGRVLTDDLIGDAFTYGNCLRLINDYRLDVENYTDPVKPGHPTENVAFVEVSHFGWPIVFVVTLCDVFGGHELLIDYGEIYWDSFCHIKKRHNFFEKIRGQVNDLDAFVKKSLLKDEE